MKIGIMTFWESQDNYGQILQAFALCTYLEQMGHDPFLIRYHRVIPPASIRSRLSGFNLKDFIARRVKQGTKNKATDIPTRGFDAFKEKYLRFSADPYFTVDDLKRNPPRADVYITGSDQVWNNSFKVSCEAFLLGFGNTRTIRLSYAASFGMKSLDEKTTLLFNAHLARFNGVSVREKSGIGICREVGYKIAVWVPDPTLLFNQQQWVSLLSLGTAREEAQKIFVYIVGNGYIKHKNSILNYVHHLPGKTVDHATANGSLSGNSFPGIEQWINNIRQAAFVLTNSFHGMVFCIIFHKNFIMLPNGGRAEGMNERITSLLGKLDLEDHIMYEFNQPAMDVLLKKQIDWDRISILLDEWKLDAHAFLEEHLHRNEFAAAAHQL